MNYIGEKIVLARESRGYTQLELSEKLDIAQGTLSKIEQGFQSVSEELIECVAKKLRYPVSFFIKKEELVPTTLGYYRKLQNVPKRSLIEYEARMNIIRIHLERFLKNIELPNLELPSWDVESDGSPKLAARALREQWNIPSGPVKNLTTWIESKGIPIMLLDFGEHSVDGLSMYSNEGTPIIFADSNSPSDRLRATIAHELGHLVMHFKKRIREDRDIESEAWLFAGEFLLPTKEISKINERITLESLARLKRYWKVSMAFIIMKLAEENVINYNQNRYLWAQMTKLGYRKKEPSELDFEKETPILFELMFENHLSNLNYSKNELSEFLDMYYDELFNLYKLSSNKLKIVI